VDDALNSAKEQEHADTRPIGEATAERKTGTPKSFVPDPVRIPPGAVIAAAVYYQPPPGARLVLPPPEGYVPDVSLRECYKDRCTIYDPALGRDVASVPAEQIAKAVKNLSGTLCYDDKGARVQCPWEKYAHR